MVNLLSKIHLGYALKCCISHAQLQPQLISFMLYKIKETIDVFFLKSINAPWLFTFTTQQYSLIIPPSFIKNVLLSR